MGYHAFLSKIFCLTVPKKFVGELSVFYYSRVSESSVHRRGITHFSVEFFLLTVLRNIVRVYFIVWLISDLSKIFIYERGISRFYVDFFVSHYRNKNQSNPVVFQQFLGIQRLYEWEVGYHNFLSKTFCVTVPKTFSDEPFTVSESFWFRTIFRTRGVYYEVLSIFLSHIAEKVRRGSYMGFINFGYQKVVCRRGVNHDILSNYFCLTPPI